MKAFTYERAKDVVAAARAATRPGAKFLAGGTNLLDLMKIEVETPTHLIDVQDLGLDRISKTDDGGLRVGAFVTNTALAADERIRRDLMGHKLTRERYGDGASLAKLTEVVQRVAL